MSEVDEESKQVSYRVVRDENGNVKLDCPAIGKQFAAEEITAQVETKGRRRRRNFSQRAGNGEARAGVHPSTGHRLPGVYCRLLQVPNWPRSWALHLNPIHEFSFPSLCKIIHKCPCRLTTSDTNH